jgi:DNA polymerase-3 subunit delta'
MNLDLLNNQKNLIDFLTNAYKKQRLAHAYIFEGDNGVGKNELAHYFAALLYSKDNVDLNSNTTRLIFNDEHLNVFVIYPDGKNIKKDQIKALQEEFSKTSQLEGPRIYIINDADKMNLSSQNSLLKFIEEPPLNVYGVLLTTNAKALLPTILSRCQMFKLNDLSSDLVYKLLIKDNIDKKDALLISLLTNDIEEGKELANNTYMIKLFDMFNKFFNIKRDRDTIKYFNELGRVSNDINLFSYYIKLLIIAYEDMLYLNKGNLSIHLSTYADKLYKFLERIDESKAIHSLDYLYKISRLLNNSNVSIKNIITSMMFNLL